MTEVQHELDLEVAPAISDPGKAAVERHYMRQGRLLEEMRLSLANLAQDGLYVYQLQMRWPVKGKPAHMLMMKALRDDGPLIAFHSDHGWIATFLGVAHRLRAGDIEWHQDEYPPEDWLERLSEMHKTTHYLD